MLQLLALYLIVSSAILFFTTGAASAEEFPLKNCHLVSSKTRRISAALTLLVSAPELRAHEWICYQPLPPELPGQQSLLFKEVLLDNKPFAFSVKEELSQLHRSLLLARVPASSTGLMRNLNLRADYLIELNSKELVDGAAAAKVNDDGAGFLSETNTLNFNSREFKNWLVNNRLLRGEGERDLDFAWRLYTWIRSNYDYLYQRDQNRKISSLCGIRGTDCGGLSFLFCGALRANKIPARPLVGRWFKASPDDDNGKEMGQVHVKSEFLAGGIGWVPVDMSFAVSNKSDDPLKYFGRFNGDFVTFHVGTDMLVDSVWFGASEIPWMQSPLFWATGAGNFDGVSNTVYWQTRAE